MKEQIGSGRAALAWLTESRLVSLLEIMEEFFAERFHVLGWILGYSEGYGVFEDSETEFPDSSRGIFLDRMREAKEECQKIGLRVCVVHLEEIVERLEDKKPLPRNELASLAREFHNSVKREMRTTKFFRLSPDTQSYFEATEGFGKQVSESFPSAEYDIKEAGSCLALSRATACVYHAMRVLEYGLCALADRFSVPFEHKSWNDVIEPIEKAIRQIKNDPNKPPNWKDEEQFYSEAASQFMHFKNAWRNYTAHRQFKYTETEAEAIFRHVRDFMRHIARQLREKKATP
jgi:hypothetical protein